MKYGLGIELSASVFTLAGIYAGSTTLLGCLLYCLANGFWFVVIFGNRLWGLIPVTVGSTIIIGFNLARATL